MVRIKSVNMAVLLVLFLVFVSCMNRGKEAVNKYTEVKRKLENSLDSLTEERKHAESFIASAEVHQVLRTREEKERQLNNLRYYYATIESKMDSVQNLIILYSDSIRSNE